MAKISVDWDFTSYLGQVNAIREMLNLYLFGQIERPEYFGSHIRSDSNDAPSIEIDSSWLLGEDGPARFIKAPLFEAVQIFFSGVLDVSSHPNYSETTNFAIDATDLIGSGLTAENFILRSIQQSQISGPDLLARGFIFNSSTFVLESSPLVLEFFAGGAPSSIAGINIRSGQNTGDNFDFESSDSNNLGNEVLENIYDPYELGQTVEISYSVGFRDDGFLTLGEYLSAPKDIESLTTQAVFALLAIDSSLQNDLGIYLDDREGGQGGRMVVYGTNEADAELHHDNSEDVHLVGGAGDDNIRGSSGDDYLEGNDNQDILDGRAGDDILVGGEGADILIGGAGNDKFYGNEEVDENDGTTRIVEGAPDNDEDIDTVDYTDSNSITLDMSSLSEAQIAAGMLMITDDGQGGEDTLFGIERIIATDGDDRFNFSVSFDDTSLQSLDGGDGFDTVDFSAAMSGITLEDSNEADGFDGIEQYILTNQNDTIQMSVENTGSDDILFDTNEGVDIITLTLQGGDFTTRVFAEGGADVISVTGDNFDVYGGINDDIITVSGTGAGTAYVFGGADSDIIHGSNALLFGGGGEDFIYSDGGDTELFGVMVEGLTDTFDADGNPTANSGQQTLVDDGAADGLFGGSGRDVFHAANGDVIVDYQAGQDEINIYSDFLGIGEIIIQTNNEEFIEREDYYQHTTPMVPGGVTIVFSDIDGDSVAFIDGVTILDITASMVVDAYLSGYDAGVRALFSSINFVQDDTIFLQTQASTGEAGPSLNSIESQIEFNGTLFDDQLIGNDLDNQIYGNMGNDVLSGGNGNDAIYGGLRDDIVNGDAGDDTLYGGIGTDVLNGDEGDDLLIGNQGNDTLSGGEGNDSLDSGAGNDYLNGGVGSDDLFGNDGDDILIGGAGADIIDGWLGQDLTSYEFSPSAVTVTLGASDFYFSVGPGQGFGGDAEGDELWGIENLLGSSFDDTLTGNEVDNTINGGDGNDFLRGDGGDDTIDGGFGVDILRGGSGADILDGGAGQDWADYITSSAAVTVNLLADTGTGGDAEGDTYILVERVYGSSYDDHITGDNGVNYLRGWAGDDQLFGGAGNDYLQGGVGADILDGGAGSNDWAYYVSSAIGLTIDLGDASNNTGEAIGDTYTDIENIVGSRHDDIITGDSNGNFLRGLQGDDVLNGGGGDDFLRGELGADVHNGGAGNDWAYYAVSAAAITIDLGANTASGGDATGDSFISIERVYGSRYADSITGDSGANYLRGYFGNDTINGGDGNDFLQGDSGADILNGGAGSDWAYYFSSTSTSGITINLGDSSQNTGEAIGDSYISIENIVGSRFDDIIIGDSGDNYLRGAQGDDTINGGAGDDILRGESGDDTFVFTETTFGGDIITDFTNGSDMLDFSALGFGLSDFTVAQVGNDTLLTLISDTDQTLLLQNFTATDLDAADFASNQI